MKLLKSEILWDCKEWKACNGAIVWLRKSRKKYIEIKDVPKKSWVAWYLYLAGLNWKDERFTPEIEDALIKTGNAGYLYWAGCNWKDGRFTPEIRDALIKTGNAVYIFHAGWDWPDERKKDWRGNEIT